MTARECKVAGIEVSQEVYDDYTNRRYQTRLGEMPLRTVDLYANSKGIAETEPEFSEECRAILEQIREEIMQQMRKAAEEAGVTIHPDFIGYLEDLRSLYVKVTGERKRMVEEHEKAVAEWDHKAYEANGSTSTAPMLKAKAGRAEEMERFQEETEIFLENVALQVDAIRTALKNHLKEFYSLDGAKIDDDTVRLLNSGIRLSEKEVNDMFTKFSGNITMLRLLSDYCQSHDLDCPDAIVLGTRATSEGSHELEVFNQNANNLMLAAGAGSEVSEKVWSPENGHFEKILDEGIRELTEVIVKPGV